MSIKQKFLGLSLLIGLFFVFSPLTFANPTGNSVVGYWQTIDDKTKAPSSIIQIQRQGQFYIGKIAKIYSVTDKSQAPRCTQCKGARKNKSMLGLEIIQNMQCTATSCRGGTILDPRDGKVYKATMNLSNNGKALKVRGYVGVSLLGQTVTWIRTSSAK